MPAGPEHFSFAGRMEDGDDENDDSLVVAGLCRLFPRMLPLADSDHALHHAFCLNIFGRSVG